MMKKENSKTKLLYDSFKDIYSKNSLFCIIADILFVIVMVISLLLCVAAFGKILETFNALAPTIFTLKTSIAQNASKIPFNTDALREMKGSLDGIVSKLIWVIVAFVILLIICISVFKGYIWSRISEEKFTKRYFLKFLLLNVIWMGIWIFILITVLFRIKTPANLYLLAPALLLADYLTLVLYSRFSSKDGIMDVFGNAIKLCFRRNVLNYLFLVFILLLLVIFSLVLLSTGILSFIMLILLIFAVYLHWSRVYFYSSVR